MTLAENEHRAVVSLEFQKRSALKSSSRTIPSIKSRGMRSASGIISGAKRSGIVKVHRSNYPLYS